MVISLLLLLISIAHSDVFFGKMKICVQGSSARPKWPLKPRNKNIASLKLCIPLALLHYSCSLFAICTSPIKQNVNPQHFPSGLSSIFLKTTVKSRRNGTNGLFNFLIKLFIFIYLFFLNRGRGSRGKGGGGGKEDVLWEIWNGELAIHVYVVYVSREFKESYTGPDKASLRIPRLF